MSQNVQENQVKVEEIIEKVNQIKQWNLNCTNTIVTAIPLERFITHMAGYADTDSYNNYLENGRSDVEHKTEGTVAILIGHPYDEEAVYKGINPYYEVECGISNVQDIVKIEAFGYVDHTELRDALLNHFRNFHEDSVGWSNLSEFADRKKVNVVAIFAQTRNGELYSLKEVLA